MLSSTLFLISYVTSRFWRTIWMRKLCWARFAIFRKLWLGCNIPISMLGCCGILCTMVCPIMRFRFVTICLMYVLYEATLLVLIVMCIPGRSNASGSLPRIDWGIHRRTIESQNDSVNIMFVMFTCILQDFQIFDIQFSINIIKLNIGTTQIRKTWIQRS